MEGSSIAQRTRPEQHQEYQAFEFSLDQSHEFVGIRDQVPVREHTELNVTGVCEHAHARADGAGLRYPEE